jgi:hypothetical protein
LFAVEICLLKAAFYCDRGCPRPTPGDEKLIPTRCARVWELGLAPIFSYVSNVFRFLWWAHCYGESTSHEVPLQQMVACCTVTSLLAYVFRRISLMVGHCYDQPKVDIDQTNIPDRNVKYQPSQGYAAWYVKKGTLKGNTTLGSSRVVSRPINRNRTNFVCQLGFKIAADTPKMKPKIRAVTTPSVTARILCPSGLVFWPLLGHFWRQLEPHGSHFGPFGPHSGHFCHHWGYRKLFQGQIACFLSDASLGIVALFV